MSERDLSRTGGVFFVGRSLEQKKRPDFAGFEGGGFVKSGLRLATRKSQATVILMSGRR